jgi:hypothetical protein
MNYRSFSFRASLAFAVAAAAFALATPASAQTCSGCTTPSPSMGLTISGVSAFGGNGASVFEGQSGFGKVTKQGGATMDITLGANGGACPGGCGDSTYTVQGRAFEQVNAMGAALSRGAGIQAGVANTGRAEALVGFTKNVIPATGQ